MADVIRVHYQSLDESSAVMQSSAAAMDQLIQDHHAKAQATYSLWHAGTAQQHNFHLTAGFKIIQEMGAIGRQVGILDRAHGETTQNTDNSLANRFELA